MLVPCPHCGFLVALILPAQDGEQRDAQRCPRCGGWVVSTAPTNEPDAADTMKPATDPAVGDAEAMDAAAANARRNGVSAVPADAATESPDALAITEPLTAAHTPAAPRPPPRRARRTPSFVRHATPAAGARRRRPWSVLAIAALLLVLALQLLLAQRQELAASARWRPLIAGLCAVVQCALPPWREPAAFTMLGRNVQPKPGSLGVLIASASFRNDARWAQPWPTLLLSLSDIDGHQVGLRAFTPAEYRAGTATDEALAPGQSATVQFEVVEPAPRIVAFTFDFQ